MPAVFRLEGAIVKTVVVAQGGTLPAATVTDSNLFVVYGLDEADTHTLWLATEML
ncbi:MAG TPA: hypothetical protein VGJ48_03395 [Pyrinomonadaceae bacterium]|jgi:hypothetical protein